MDGGMTRRSTTTRRHRKVGRWSPDVGAEIDRDTMTVHELERDEYPILYDHKDNPLVSPKRKTGFV